MWEIELKKLSLGYGGKAVIKNLSLKIGEGDFICLVGPNGAGKSTLIKGILGLIKPISGEILFNGIHRNEVGFLAQESGIDPNFPATVEEIVLSGKMSRDYDAMREKMKLVGISKLAGKSFGELSGGQKQRVLIARALMATSKLLILDEPANSLDYDSAKKLYQILGELNSQGITIIMVTHDLDHGNLIGNKILSLRDEVFYGTTEEFVRKVHHA